MQPLTCETIVQAAKKHIPRGKVTKLQILKKERDQARKRAEKHKTPENRIKWKQKTAKLKKEINNAKKNAFNDFVE